MSLGSFSGAGRKVKIDAWRLGEHVLAGQETETWVVELLKSGLWSRGVSLLVFFCPWIMQRPELSGPGSLPREAPGLEGPRGEEGSPLRSEGQQLLSRVVAPSRRAVSIVAFLLTKGAPRRPLKAGAGWREGQNFQERAHTGAVCLVCTVFFFFFLILC